MDDLFVIEKELDIWAGVLNVIVGVSSFTFLLACLALPKYWDVFAGVLSVVMWGALMASARSSFSKRLEKLRLRRDEPRAKEILEYVDANFFSNRKFSPYIVGSVSLVSYVLILIIYRAFELFKFFAN